MSDNRLVFSFMQPIYRIGICAHWPLIRFIVGMNLIPHGYRKLFGGSVEKTAAAFGKIDFPFPFDLFSSLSLTYVVAVTEFFGGILIIVGLLTRLAAAAAMPVRHAGLPAAADVVGAVAASVSSRRVRAALRGNETGEASRYAA